LREVIASVEFIVVSRPGRRQLAAGDDRVDAPPAVLAYIREHGL
jgi:hypothetical protein